MQRQDQSVEGGYSHVEAGFVNKEDYVHVGRIGWIRKVIDMFWQDQLNRHLEARLVNSEVMNMQMQDWLNKGGYRHVQAGLV